MSPLPTRQTVLQAIGELRRSLVAEDRPGTEQVPWAPATPGACRACTEEGPRFHPARLARIDAAPLELCPRTLAEIFVATRLPSGAHLEEILGTVERWMRPGAARESDPRAALGALTSGRTPSPPGRASDPPPPEAAAPAPSCLVCGRAAENVARLVMIDDEGGVCGACAAAASSAVPAEVIAEARRVEVADASAELADLERIRSLSGDASIRANPTMALSVVRMLDVSDPEFRNRLHAAVKVLDAESG